MFHTICAIILTIHQVLAAASLGNLLAPHPNEIIGGQIALEMKAQTTMTPIIKIRNLCKRFKDPVHRGGWLEIVRGIDLDVKAGQVVAIMGGSGAGKSTLLRCMSLLVEPDEGTVEIDGIKIPAGGYSRERTWRIIELGKRVGVILYTLNLFPNMTVLQNIIERPTVEKKWPQERAIAKAEELLDWIGLLDQRDKYPHQLSDSQQQRIAIVRELAMEPRVMLFDEPTAALYPALSDEVIEVMEQVAGQGMTMVVVSRRVRFVRNVAQRVIFMDDGRFVEEASPDEFFSNPQDERTRQFLDQILPEKQ